MKSSPHRQTAITSTTPDATRQAAAILRGGGLVVFPTETVYGLGADAQNPDAVRAMFTAKGRPPDHPVIMHLADSSLIDEFATEVPPAARTLAAAFWPGPMTLVLRRSSQVSDLITGGLETVGIRVPRHPVAQALLREFGGPIAAPSANRFGRVSATRVEHVIEELGGRVDLILDAGPCEVGLESTIIELSSEQPAVLRPGAVTSEQIAAALGYTLAEPAPHAPRVSGSLESHYAPQARIEIVAPADLAARARELSSPVRRVAVLTSDPAAVAGIENVVAVKAPEDDAQFAHDLYALLRRVDELGCHIALVTLPPEKGLGIAIADRLRRAAGPR